MLQPNTKPPTTRELLRREFAAGELIRKIKFGASYLLQISKGKKPGWIQPPTWFKLKNGIDVGQKYIFSDKTQDVPPIKDFDIVLAANPEAQSAFGKNTWSDHQKDEILSWMWSWFNTNDILCYIINDGGTGMKVVPGYTDFKREIEFHTGYIEWTPHPKTLLTIAQQVLEKRAKIKNDRLQELYEAFDKVYGNR